MSKYQKPMAGEWMRTFRRMKHRCCDCGLVHIIDHKVSGRQLWVRYFRDERSTAAGRRCRKTPLQNHAEIVKRSIRVAARSGLFSTRKMIQAAGGPDAIIADLGLVTS